MHGHNSRNFDIGGGITERWRVWGTADAVHPAIPASLNSRNNRTCCKNKKGSSPRSFITSRYCLALLRASVQHRYYQVLCRGGVDVEKHRQHP
jgi:hypothetical protein